MIFMRRFLYSLALVLGLLTLSILPVSAQEAIPPDVVGPPVPATPVSKPFCSYDKEDGTHGCENLWQDKDNDTQEIIDQRCTNLCPTIGGSNCETLADCPISLANPLRVPKIPLSNPTGVSPNGTNGIADLIGHFIGQVLSVVGAITLAVFIYGGFRWLTSAGNEEKVKEGSQTMLYAALGLFIIFASYGILSVVLSTLAR